MKLPAVLIFGLALVSQVWGKDLQIARCDIERVFNEYQHTRDIEAIASARRNQSGPQTARDLPETARFSADVALQTIERRWFWERREQQLKEEVVRQRQEVLDEILAEIRVFALERDYDFIVTAPFPRDGNPTPLIVTRRSKDVTDELLTRLNEHYARVPRK